MAKRAKDLGDWKIVMDVPVETISTPSTPTRRTRRGTSKAAENAVSLLRISDSLTLAKGDCILISGEPKYIDTGAESYYAVVIDIKTGIHRHLEVQVAPLVRHPEAMQAQVVEEKPEQAKDDSTKEIPEETDRFHANELLLTSEVNNVLLTDIVDTVKVLSSEKFAEVAIDASSESLVFLCCRATDRFMEKILEKFDFSAWCELLAKSPGEAIEFVAEKTLIIVSPKKKWSPTKTIQDRISQSLSLAKKTYAYDSSCDDNESDLSSDNEDEEEEGDRKRRRNMKRRELLEAKAIKGLPRKRKAAGSGYTVSPKKGSREAARETEVYKQALGVLSPHKRGFKIKSGSSLASLPSLSRDVSDVNMELERHVFSEAFRQLKEKLQTSTLVALLPCREEQFEYVYTNLEVAVMEKMGCCLYLSGTPGVGKTATVREVIRTLRASVDQGFVHDFDYLEINCLNLLTPQSAYEKLYEHISGIKVTPYNASILLEEYFGKARADPQRKPLIVLVDELDQLLTKNQKVIYNFFNWPTYEHSRFVVLAVANTMDLPERAFSNKIASRLGLRRFAFRGYTEEELGIIIAHRLTLLSEANKRKVEISADAMRFASKKVALVSGDARRALNICRRAVEIAEQEFLAKSGDNCVPDHRQSYSVMIAHIGKAISETVNSPVAQVLEGLSFAAKLLLVGVILRIRRSGQGENPLGEVMDEMRNSLQLLTTKGSTHALRGLSENANYVSLLFGDKRTDASGLHVRLHHVTQIINELVEQGILAQQNIRSNRHRLVSLNVSEEEITPGIRRDLDIAAML